MRATAVKSQKLNGRTRPPKARSRARKRAPASRETLGPRVRRLRKDAGLTLKQLAARTGLAFSTIAKVETSKISPTYENILRLAHGLNVDVTELFASQTTEMTSGRRTWTRAGEGARHVSPQYEYQMLCVDIARKKFIPLLTTIRAHDIAQFPQLLRHQGEEFIFVISGEIDVFTDQYEPLRLRPGDSCYFDSTMGHACVSAGKIDAVILWVCSRIDPPLDGVVPPIRIGSSDASPTQLLSNGKHPTRGAREKAATRNPKEEKQR
ncbi:MAG: helix-turn-helix domain-containing protein [Variibacter sp.]